MPSNNVLVNYALSFDVNDSQMDELMDWLRLNSWCARDLFREEGEATEVCRTPEKSSNR